MARPEISGLIKKQSKKQKQYGTSSYIIYITMG